LGNTVIGLAERNGQFSISNNGKTESLSVPPRSDVKANTYKLKKNVEEQKINAIRADSQEDGNDKSSYTCFI